MSWRRRKSGPLGAYADGKMELSRPEKRAGWQQTIWSRSVLRTSSNVCCPRRTLPVERASASEREPAEDSGSTPHARFAPGLIDAYAGAPRARRLRGRAGEAGAPARTDRRNLQLHCRLSKDMKPASACGALFRSGLARALGSSKAGQSSTERCSIISCGCTEGDYHRRPKPMRRSSSGSGNARASWRGLCPRLHCFRISTGNRSPLRDPHALGVTAGCRSTPPSMRCAALLADLRRDSARIRHILEMMKEAGYELDTLHVTGGACATPC